MAPGTVRRYSTLHSIGVEWDIEGDINHHATCAVEYRQAGRAEWSKALDLLRIDYHGWHDKKKADRHYNMLAGSLFFLKPGAKYEVRLKDPDGGDRVEQFEIATRPVPVLPAGGRTFHVVPGDGGGRGTEADPFRRLAEADMAAHTMKGSDDVIAADLAGRREEDSTRLDRPFGPQ